MTVDLDDAVRSTLADIVARTPDAGPTPTAISGLAPSHRRLWVSMTAAATVIVVVAAIALTAMNDTSPRSLPNADLLVTSPQPVDTTAAATPTIAAEATDAPASVDLVGVYEFDEWIGPVAFDFRDESVVVGSTGTATYSIEMTATTVCLVTSLPGEAEIKSCDHNAVDPALRPSTMSALGGTVLRPGRWYTSRVLPSDIDHVEALDDGTAACAMRRFSLDQLGDADLWACEAQGAAPYPVVLAATRDDETLASDGHYTTPFDGDSVDGSAASSTTTECGQDETCYVVKTGDYPLLVAQRLCTTLTELTAANDVNDVNDLPLVPGQVLRAPAISDQPTCPDPPG